MTLNVLILAAGLGTRMKSNKPKVMHKILGKPILEYIIDASSKISPSRTILLISPKQEDMRIHFEKQGLWFAVQEKQLGTGDAVKSAMQEVEENADLMVLAGDVPMIRTETLKMLYEKHVKEKASITFLTMLLENPKGYGRVKKSEETVERIVEEKDATEEIKKIKEVNSGIYVFAHDFLKEGIKLIKNENAQKEYYLTDLISIAHGRKLKTIAVPINDSSEVSGINDRKQLSDIEQAMLYRKLCSLMQNGVTIRSPQTVYIDDKVLIGADTEIGSHVVLKGSTVIGERAVIKDFSYINNKKIADGEIIQPFTVLDE
ncbi:MAG: sugar phosphate nucleotidyltransferase [bacterium]|nr:sugar phosphate nucleotidyltransferase [bacterium]